MIVIKETLTNGERWDNITSEILELKNKWELLIKAVKIDIDDDPRSKKALKFLQKKLKNFNEHIKITQTGLTAQYYAKRKNDKKVEHELKKVVEEAITALTEEVKSELKLLRPVFEDKND